MCGGTDLIPTPVVRAITVTFMYYVLVAMDMDGRRTERQWFATNGVDDAPLDTLQEEYGSLVRAADVAVMSPDDLPGDVPADAVDALGDLAPLQPPGEWQAERDDPGYRFACGDAEIRIVQTDEGDYEVQIDGSLEDADGIRESKPLIAAYWTARRIMSHNPQGADGLRPEDVETPWPWMLWQDHHHTNGGTGPVAWKNRDTGDVLRVKYMDGGYELRYESGDSPVLRIATGDFDDVLETAEMQMETLVD